MIPLEKILEISSARATSVAIVTEDESISWLDFSRQVRSLVDSLSDIHDAADIDTICYISPNRIELLYLAAAAATLKIPFIGLDYSLDSDHLVELQAAASCSLLITSSLFCSEAGIDLNMLSSGTIMIDLDNRIPTAITYDSLLTNEHSEKKTLSSNRAFKAISFTSGTSGTPKAVLRFQSFDTRRFSYFTTRYGFSAQDRHLLAIPLYHAAGNGWARLFLQLGSTLVLAPHDNPAALAKLIRSEWITTSAMTPPLLMQLLDYAKSNNLSLLPNSLRFLLVGGKNFPAHAKQYALKAMGPVIYEYYGTTETGVNTIAEPNDLLENPETVGKPYDGNKVKVIGPDDIEVPVGTVGRIAISSYMNMDNYQNAKSNKVLIDGKRYLATPETGYFDSDGFLYLMNRTDGVSTLNLFDIENQINKLPCIDDVALLTVPDTKADVICALVVKSESSANVELIQSKVQSLLKSYNAVAAEIGILNKIPYSPSGKVRAPDLLMRLKKTAESSEAAIRFTASKNFVTFLIGVLCLIGTTISWGAMFPIAKNALQSIDAVHISLVRYGLASIILMIMLAISEGYSALKPGKDLIKLWFFGSLGFAGFSILAFAGLAHTKAQHGAIIMALMPLISVVMIWILQSSKPRPFTIGTIVLALTGVVLVVTQGDLTDRKSVV